MSSMAELFNAELVLERPLHELWNDATAFGQSDNNSFLRLRSWAGEGGLLLRGHPGTQFDPEVSVKSTLQLAKEHLQKLGQLGAFVIQHAFEVAQAADSLGTGLASTSNVPVAYSAARYVNHMVKLDTVMRPDAAKIAELVKPEVLQPLEKYIAWCTRTRPSHMLADIYRPDQYSYHWETQHIFLHDIDPLVDRADADMIESSWDRLQRFSSSDQN